ncbi:MAG: phasin family protein [Acidovorax sp.]|uniref:TIGR01841 family phasin n=1 Tax=Acidovorax sp. TaxID=1872122 RepID=UPI0039E5DFE0
MATSKKTTAPEIPGIPTLDDLKKMAQQFKLPGVDVSALIEWQRKDLEALAEANRQAYEGMQALAQRRAEMLRENFAQWQDALKNAAGADALSRNTEAVQRGVQQAIDNMREMAALEAATRTNAWKVLQDRMQENMANLGQLLKPRK